jgi:serine/threonine-protein kinase
MPSFEIPDGPVTVPLMSQSVSGKPLRTATVTFTVTNKTNQSLSCRLKAAAQADAKGEWLELQGEKERPFAASETQKVTVGVSVPADVKPADFKFRLQAMNVNDPGNDYAESAVATLTFAPPPPPPNKIWPYLLIAAALVVIVGGFATWMLWPKPPPAPPPPPPTNSAQVMVPMPDATSPPQNVDIAHATSFLAANGFRTFTVGPPGAATGAQPGTVIAQTPSPQTLVPQASIPTLAVTLSLDPGVPIPTNLVGATLTNVGAQLAPFATTVKPLADDGVPDGGIVSLSPPSGTFAKGSPLVVSVHSPACHDPRCWRVPMTLHQYNQSMSQFVRPQP